jgi:hypothetical protein
MQFLVAWLYPFISGMGRDIGDKRDCLGSHILVGFKELKI